MDTQITANLLNRIGLFLGLISGLLLIPEVLNLLPIEKLEKSTERQLYKFENWARFPLKFSPPSWKENFTEEQREAIEPITAIRTFIFSIVWIAILVAGILYSSRFFIVLSFIILIVVVLGNVRRIYVLWPRLSLLTLISMFIVSLFMLAIVTPPISLLRVVMLILRSVVARVRSFFSTNNVLRVLLTILAITTFIISNILQFVATFYE